MRACLAMRIAMGCLCVLLAGASECAPVHVKELIDRPKKFADECVLVRGVVRTDFQHLILLYDETDQKAGGIALLFPDEVRNTPAVNSLFDELLKSNGRRGANSRVVMATFEGAF